MGIQVFRRSGVWGFRYLALGVLAGCGPKPPPDKTATPPSAPAVAFRNVAREVGLDFRHVNGAAGNKFMPETMGSGCAFFDYDNDGWIDLLLVNGTYWPGQRGKARPTLRLYRNLGGKRFQDVTKEARLDVEMYGMGVAVGDYDNDGWRDIYVTGVGACRLLHNEGVESRESRVESSSAQHSTPDAQRPMRRFLDVTKEAGVESPGWATSATWVDYDRDGDLDLFVCHYVQWSPKTDRYYSIDGVHKSYATPMQYPGETCRLYRNRRVESRESGVERNGLLRAAPSKIQNPKFKIPDVRFEDVTRAAGIYNPRSKALGVVVCDIDQDGWPDLIVANDTEPNFLFHNQGNGTFKEVALESGIAIAETGRAKAGMGIDAGDEQNNGQDSIVITNFAGEQLTLYRRDASGAYLDVAARSGIGNASQLYLGFGVFFFDYDLDGWLDIFVANGHIQDDAAVRQTGVAYEEPSLLLRNQGNGSYQDETAKSGAALVEKVVGRGTAWGDFDNDGSPDILLTVNNGPARLLRAESRAGNNWLRIQLEGTTSNRDAIGARVRVRVGSRTLTQMVKGASSYLSQSDSRLLFGLEKAAQADAIEIHWPSGLVQTLGSTPANRLVFVRETGNRRGPFGER